MPQRARGSGGFVLWELVMVAVVGTGTAAVLAVASPRTRAMGSLGESSAKLRRLGQAQAAFAADNTDRVGTFWWTKGNCPSQYPDLRNAATDVEAAAFQATDIIRRRAGLPTFAKLQGWVPHIAYSHLATADYLDDRVPFRAGISPEDANLLKWSSDPALWQQNGAPTQRHCFASSYEMPPAYWSSPESGSNAVHQDGQTHNSFLVPSGMMPGRRSFAEVRYPAHKAMVYDKFQRHFGVRTGFFMYEEARVPVLMADLSLAVRAGRDSNRGWKPQNPSAGPSVVTYTPASYEPPALSGVSNANSGRMRWTRKGLGGRDVDGGEVPYP